MRFFFIVALFASFSQCLHGLVLEDAATGPVLASISDFDGDNVLSPEEFKLLEDREIIFVVDESAGSFGQSDDRHQQRREEVEATTSQLIRITNQIDPLIDLVFAGHNVSADDAEFYQAYDSGAGVVAANGGDVENLDALFEDGPRQGPALPMCIQAAADRIPEQQGIMFIATASIPEDEDAVEALKDSIDSVTEMGLLNIQFIVYTRDVDVQYFYQELVLSNPSLGVVLKYSVEASLTVTDEEITLNVEEYLHTVVVSAVNSSYDVPSQAGRIEGASSQMESRGPSGTFFWIIVSVLLGGILLSLQTLMCYMFCRRERTPAVEEFAPAYCSQASELVVADQLREHVTSSESNCLSHTLGRDVEP